MGLSYLVLVHIKGFLIQFLKGVTHSLPQGYSFLNFCMLKEDMANGSLKEVATYYLFKPTNRFVKFMTPVLGIVSSGEQSEGT